MRWLTLLLALINDLLADRTRLALENAALRQQLTVLRRSVKRARIHDSDRVFWILMRRMLQNWRDTVAIVKPDTVVRWHRKGWRYYWHRKCRQGTPGRPKIDPGVISVRLSRRLASAGFTTDTREPRSSRPGHDELDAGASRSWAAVCPDVRLP